MSGISSYYRNKWNELQQTSSLLSSDLLEDITKNYKIIKYPFLGIKECFKTTNYGYLLFSIFLNYLVSYVMVSIIYFYVLFPWSFFIYSVLFGPAGFILAIWHGISFSNIVACHEARASTRHFMNMVFLITFEEKRALNNTGDIKRSINKKEDAASFWRIALPTFILKWIFIVCRLALWYAVSMIPIIGVVLFKIQSSSSRGFSYFLPYYKLSCKLDSECLKLLYYKSYGKWFLIGLSTGLLESIPILSGLAICTNTCGCALWEIEIMS